MKALPIEDHRKVLHLYRRSEHRFPIINAIIDGRQRGSILVDDPHAPSEAFVVAQSGFALLLRSASSGLHPEGHDLAALLCQSNPPLPAYLLWYSPPDDWRAWLDQFPASSVRRRERVRLLMPEYLPREFEFGPAPPGMHLVPVTPDLISALDRVRLQLVPRFWESSEDFMQNAFGCAVINAAGTLVSACCAAAIAGGNAEIDVATDEAYRGRGLALAAAGAFCLTSRQRGLIATWDCFAGNANSLSLANKLGFAEVGRYEFYTFPLPLPSLSSCHEIRVPSAIELDSKGTPQRT